MIFLLMMGVVPGAWAHGGDKLFDSLPQLNYYNSGLRATDDPDDILMQMVITNPKTAHTIMLYGIECPQAKSARIEKVHKVLGEETVQEVKEFRLEPGVTVDLSPPKYRIVLKDVKPTEDGSVTIFIHYGDPFGRVGLQIPFPQAVIILNENREKQ